MAILISATPLQFWFERAVLCSAKNFAVIPIWVQPRHTAPLTSWSQQCLWVSRGSNDDGCKFLTCLGLTQHDQESLGYLESSGVSTMSITTVLLSRFPSYLTLWDPIDGSPPGSPVPGVLQARILQWVAISLANAWKWKVKVKSLSRVRLLATSRTAAYQAPPSMGFSRQEYWNGMPLPSPNNHCNSSNLGNSFCGAPPTSSYGQPLPSFV